MTNSFITIVNNYDPDKLAPHDQVISNLGGNEVKVDKELKGILERLNNSKLITTMSCQYNNLGYTSIQFSYCGFYYIMEKIRERHLQKYNNTKIYYKDSLWCAIAMKNENYYYWNNICKFSTYMGEFDEPKKQPFYKCIDIDMYINPSHVSIFIELCDKLFK